MDEVERVDELRKRGYMCAVPPRKPNDGAVMHRDCPVHGLEAR